MWRLANAQRRWVTNTWVYVKSEPSLWTVGFWSPDGVWHPDSDHDDREKAAKRCAWLNGAGNA